MNLNKNWDKHKISSNKIMVKNKMSSNKTLYLHVIICCEILFFVSYINNADGSIQNLLIKNMYYNHRIDMDRSIEK